MFAHGSASAQQSVYWKGENIRDNAGNLLAVGSMVQLIKAGPDGTNNPAIYSGDGCTGDDQVVQTARIGDVSDGAGPLGAGELFVKFQGGEPGTVYYVRAWSAPPLFGKVPVPPALYNDSFLWTFTIGETPFPSDPEFYFSGLSGWSTTLTALPAEDLFVPPLNDWVVYEGRLLRQFVSTENPAKTGIARETENVMLVVNTKRSQTNSVLITWSRAGGTNRIVSASLEYYPASERKDKSLRPVAARGVFTLSFGTGDTEGAVLLGMSTWAGRYNAATGIPSEKRSLSLAGRALSLAVGEESYGTETLRYNQTLSDRMSGAVLEDAQAILEEYVARRAKVNVGEIDLTIVAE